MIISYLLYTVRSRTHLLNVNGMRYRMRDWFGGYLPRAGIGRDPPTVKISQQAESSVALLPA